MSDPITASDVLRLFDRTTQAMPYTEQGDRFLAVSLDREHTENAWEFTVYEDHPDGERQVATGLLQVVDLVDARPEPDWREEAAIDAADARREEGL